MAIQIPDFGHDAEWYAAQRGQVPIRVAVQRVRVSPVAGGKFIRWRRLALRPRERSVPPTLLRDFCALSRQDASAIATFADDWGVLGQRLVRSLLKAEGGGLSPSRGRAGLWDERIADINRRRGDRGIEPVTLWHCVAAKTRALARLSVALLIADEIADETTTARKVEDWRQAIRWTNHRIPWRLQAEQQQELVAQLLEEWLDRVGGFKVTVRTPHASPAVGLEGLGPVAAAASLIVVGLGSRASLAVCANCEEPYLPNRRPASGRETFCPDADCGPRAASRRWKKKKRQEKIEAGGVVEVGFRGALKSIQTRGG